MRKDAGPVAENICPIEFSGYMPPTGVAVIHGGAWPGRVDKLIFRKKLCAPQQGGDAESHAGLYAHSRRLRIAK